MDRRDGRERTAGARALVEATYAHERGRLVSVLTRDLGDLDLAEDALQDAVVEAMRTWPVRGTPEHGAAWLLTTARNRGIDRLRRTAKGLAKERSAHASEPVEDPVFDQIVRDADIPDERLRLMFACAHPAVARKDAVALTLRSVGGVPTPDIARAFLVQETAMQARLTRAKARIRDAGIRYRVPDHHELPDRLPPVLDVLALMYRQGYHPGIDPDGGDIVRRAAIELADVLASHLPDEPEALGCHALLLFHEVRQPARVDGQGELVPLEDQDRAHWRIDLLAPARDRLARAGRLGAPGPFQLQAAISAEHSTAATAAETDWPRIVSLYDQLLAVAPSPTTEIGRAVAVGMAEGPRAGLDMLPSPDPPLDAFHRWHAARADLLARAGDADAAATAYRDAARLATDPAERRWLERRAAVVARR